MKLMIEVVCDSTKHTGLVTPWIKKRTILLFGNYQASEFVSLLYLSNGTDVLNGTTSIPKSVLHFVSGLRTSTLYLDFYKLPCYPLMLLFPNKRSDEELKERLDMLCFSPDI